MTGFSYETPRSTERRVVALSSDGRKARPVIVTEWVSVMGCRPPTSDDWPTYGLHSPA
jgi:hypothetical protein